jgi:c-di-GMP-binding flagellar brake protein YcgR
MTQPGEQRAAARRELEIPVYLGDAQNRVHGTIRFDTRDFSVGGAFLRSDLLFEIGEELDVEFQLPGGPTVRTRGRVVHVARDPVTDGGAAPGMGIAFSNLSERDREAVRAFLARS